VEKVRPRNQAVIFGENSRPNCTPNMPKNGEKMQLQGQIKLLLDEFA
jgi:hypothetical protein